MSGFVKATSSLQHGLGVLAFASLLLFGLDYAGMGSVAKVCFIIFTTLWGVLLTVRLGVLFAQWSSKETR
ncbi:hypothetical protein ABHN11_24695 [Brevibacillus centrosporus]|uniref:hypothetical protein n=1 Tax=Brevibacillus centrosporus TaxID=54910 RepID=UPI003D243B43